MTTMDDALNGMNTHLRRLLMIITRTGELRVEIAQMLAVLGPDLSDEYKDKAIKLLVLLADTQEDQVEALMCLQADIKEIVKTSAEFTEIVKAYEKRLRERSRTTITRVDDSGTSTGPGVEGLAAEDRSEDHPGIGEEEK